MRKNLAKILAIAAVAFMAAGCNGKGGSSTNPSSSDDPTPKIPVLTYGEVFELETDGDYDFVHAGEEIRIEQTCVYGQYGTTLVVGVAYEQGSSILDNKGVEVELAALPNWQGITNGLYANVNVQGTLTNVDNRPVLKNATIEINAEAQYDENGDRIVDDDDRPADGAFSAGYWPKSTINRDYWGRYMNRSMNGTIFEGIFQLASVPGTVSATAESTFSVVFPGENTDGADEDNEYLIEVTIPAGLNETAVTKANEYFAGKAAGDFVDLFGITRYANGMGILFENFWGRRIKAAAAEDIPSILTSWSQVQDLYEGKFKTPVADLGAEAAGVFSYVVTDGFSESPLEAWGDDMKSKIKINCDDAGYFMADANCGSAKVEAVMTAMKAKLEAAGFVLDADTSDAEKNDLFYTLTVGGVVVSEVNIWPSDAAVQMIYASLRATNSLEDSFADAIALYESKIGGEFHSAIAALPAAQADAVESVYVDWKLLEYVSGMKTFIFTPSFTDGTFADNAAWLAFGQSYIAALKTAGFAEGYLVYATNSEGYYNATTKEFVEVYFQYGTDEDDDDTNDPIIGVQMQVCHVEDEEKSALSLIKTDAWTPKQAIAYVAYFFNIYMPQVFDSASMVVTVSASGLAAQCGSGPTWAGYDQIVGILEKYILPVSYCAGKSPAQEVPSEEDPGHNDKVVTYFLPSGTEGTYTTLQFWACSFNEGAYFYFYFQAGTYTPEA